MVGCNSYAPLGEAITKTGDHNYESGVKLSVIESYGLIEYQLKGKDDGVLIESKTRASMYQNWIIVWDGTYLWFSSSDIGSVVWVNEGGKYISNKLMKKSQLRKKMPDDIKKFTNY